MEITKIVVGIDFSEESEFASKHALDIARHTGAEIVLVHVGMIPDPVAELPKSMHAAAHEWESLLRQQLSGVRTRLESLRERMSGQGAVVSHMVRDGFPDTGLVDAAAELGADLVITGTHGRTGVKRFFLGSVSERVVRLSETNVMVARPRPTGTGGYRRILVPTDFSVPAERALEFALLLADKDATVDVVNFWQLPATTTSYYAPIKAADDLVASLRAAMDDVASRQGEDLLGRHQREGVTVQFRAVESAPNPGIEKQLAQTPPYDLVVMGSHGRRGFRRFLLGSIAESTVRHAPCSVLVVHAAGSYSNEAD